MRQVALALAVAVMVSAFASFVAVRSGPQTYTTDTAQYVTSARALLRGHGYEATSLYYEQQVAQGQGARQTIWPIGPAGSIAALAALSSQDPAAVAYWLSIIGHASAAVLLIAVALAVGFRTWAALAVCAVYLTTDAVLRNAATGLSEGPFNACVLLATVLCIKAATAERPLAHMLGAACAVSGAFLFRYAGVAAIAAFLAFSVTMAFATRQPLQSWRQFAIPILIPAAVVGATFARNYAFTGTLTGGPQVGFEEWQGLPVRSLVWATEEAIGSRSKAVILALLLVGALALALSDRRDAPVLGQGRRVEWVFPTAFIVFAALLLLWLSSTSRAYGMNVRYVVPFLPPMIVLVLFVARAAPRILSASRLAVSISLALAFAATWSYVQYSAFTQNAAWWTRGSEAPAIEAALQQRVGSRSVRDELLTMVGEHAVLLEPNGQILAMFLDRPVVGLAPAIYTDRVWTPDELRALSARFDAPLLCVFDFQLDEAHPSNANRPVIRALARGESVPGLVRVARWPGLSVFRVERDL